MITTQTLKNAAKAIGYDLWSDPDGSHYLVDYDGVKLKRWDPEHNSGDSFELMTSLDMKTKSVDGGRFVEAELYRFRRIHRGWCDYTQDRASDYRKAILLCASDFGERACQS